ncbi:MAG TPA: ABC transporter, partial [Firmicutes bacterium]|nr:ABC transporter [Bacillota bacterium]
MSPRPNFKKPGKKLTHEERRETINKLFSSLKKYIFPILLSAIFILINVVLAVLAPNYVEDLTNEISNHAATKTIDMNLVGKYVLILGLMYVSCAVCSYLSSFIVATITQRYANSLRKEITKKINLLPLAYFDGTQIGDILSRVTNDVDSLSQSIDTAVVSLLSAAFMLVASLTGMFIKSWQLGLIAMVSIPLMLLFIGMIMKLAMPQFSKRQSQIGVVQGAIEEKFSGQLVVKLFNADKKENAAFEKKNRLLEEYMFKAQFFGGLMMPVSSLISYLCYGAIIVGGGLFIANEVGGITLGTIAAFMIYVRLFQQPFTQIAQALNTLQTALAAGKRVFDFLNEGEMSDENDMPYKLFKRNVPFSGEVKFKDVSFSYDSSREIIHDFSADIKPGMKVAIVGPTGAGKTTMVNLLMRFYEINGGEISINGISTKELPRKEIHDIFGMVLQDTWIFEGSIRDNLIYNSKGVADKEILETLKEVKLDHFVDTLPNGLDYYIKDTNSISGGQRQLLTIARAMLRKSPMMILDEA